MTEANKANSPQIKLVDRLKLGDSPAHNYEAEEIMFTIIQKAADAGDWVEVPVDELHPDEGLYGKGDVRAGETPLSEGLINLKISGMVTEREREEDKKRVIVVTNAFKDYYSKLLKKADS